MDSLLQWYESCSVCPNFCGVNRLRGETGICRTGAGIVVAAADLHYGEEPVLVGSGGSGTIFFTACNLQCRFCQNYDISQLDCGREISASDMVSLMFTLESRGAENINLVTPTHQAPRIFEAVKKTKKQGLTLPVVYNCGGYENPEFLKELDGLVDIYMPDFKYGSDEAGERYSCVKNYTRYCKESLVEMHRQVGSLTMGAGNVAVRGLLVRHLVLPNRVADSKAVIDFLTGCISVDTYINIMDQYRPEYRAGEYKEIKRRVYRHEVDEVIAYARQKGMSRVLC
jgi:putative pyruvate formate lyase activating enzyme